MLIIFLKFKSTYYPIAAVDGMEETNVLMYFVPVWAGDLAGTSSGTGEHSSHAVRLFGISREEHLKNTSGSVG